MNVISKVEPDVKRRPNSSSFRKHPRNISLADRLSPSDRRLLLISSLSLLLKRARHNFAVTSDDLTRLAPYADSPSPDIESAA
jgi:hypothetical protein